jgi:2'-5' RNA ligase
MKKSVRLFVCIRPDAQALQAWEQFRQKCPVWPLRWIPAESLHITLKFLGETTVDLQPKLVAVLENATTKIPMLLGLKHGGIFPAKGPASIFWAGVDGEVGKLTQLASSVEQACTSLGFKAEPRPFHPHITVARIRSDHDVGKKTQWLHRAYQEWIAKFESLPFAVNKMILMKSSLSANGAQYEEIAAIGF